MILRENSFPFVIWGHPGKLCRKRHIIIFLFVDFIPELKRSIAGIESIIDGKNILIDIDNLI